MKSKSNYSQLKDIPFNTLTPGGFERNSRYISFNLISVIDG